MSLMTDEELADIFDSRPENSNGYRAIEKEARRRAFKYLVEQAERRRDYKISANAIRALVDKENAA